LLHLSTLPVLLSLVPSLAGDAPQWGGFRGNNGCGLSSAVGLPDALDPETNLKWRVEIPEGYSSPVVAGEKLFLTGASATAEGRTLTGKLVTQCLDATTGETRWTRELDFSGRRPGQNSPAAPSPVTDGEIVVVLFQHFGLLAYDTAGKELWRQPIGPFNLPHGMSTSPLLSGDLVVLQVDQDAGAYLIAFDKQTGAQRWRTERPGVTHSYATPAIWQPEEGPAQVVVSGTMQVAGYALTDGAKLWWLNGSAWQTKCIPVFARGRCYVNAFMPSLAEMEYPTFSGTIAEHDADGDGKVATSEFGDDTLHSLWPLFDQDHDELLDEKEWSFALATNDANGGLFAIDPSGKGDVTDSKLKWKTEDRRVLSDVTTPVVVADALFVVKDGGLLTSLDLESGEIIKRARVGKSDSFFASPATVEHELELTVERVSVLVGRTQLEQLLG
jgi:outer membrane protein assembly factor BamB